MKYKFLFLFCSFIVSCSGIPRRESKNEHILNWNTKLQVEDVKMSKSLNATLDIYLFSNLNKIEGFLAEIRGPLGILYSRVYMDQQKFTLIQYQTEEVFYGSNKNGSFGKIFEISLSVDDFIFFLKLMATRDKNENLSNENWKCLLEKSIGKTALVKGYCSQIKGDGKVYFEPLKNNMEMQLMRIESSRVLMKWIVPREPQTMVQELGSLFEAKVPKKFKVINLE